jgi:hypothetical protein
MAGFALTLEAVPSKWLRDGKLVVEEFNFSISSPNPDSEWMYTQLDEVKGSKATAFFVSASTQTRFGVLVWDKEFKLDSSTNTRKAFVEME